MNIFSIEKAFKEKRERNWDKLYWLIDLHGVVIEPKYNLYNKDAKIYPHCRRFFKWANNRRGDMVTILWTSSYPKAIKDIQEKLYKSGIIFDYCNENPEVRSDSLCDFSKKPYFNILLDDKSSFCGPTDWKLVIGELQRINEW